MRSLTGKKEDSHAERFASPQVSPALLIKGEAGGVSVSVKKKSGRRKLLLSENRLARRRDREGGTCRVTGVATQLKYEYRSALLISHPVPAILSRLRLSAC